MPVTSTGEANEASEAIVTSEMLGRRKAKGGNPYGDPIPNMEPVISQRAVIEAAVKMHTKHFLEELRKDIWFADPNVKYYPITLDPQVENILHYEGRWYSAIFLQSPQTILVQMPGLGQVSMTGIAGWNVLNFPEGTRLYAQTTRAAAWIVLANAPVGGNNPVTSVGIASGSSLAVNNFPFSGNAFNEAASQAFAIGVTNLTPLGASGSSKGAIVYLNVTAIGTGTIQLSIQVQDTVLSSWVTVFQDAFAITANGLYAFILYPGIAGIVSTSGTVPGAGNVRSAVNTVLAASWRPVITVATAPVTASVDVALQA